MVPIESGIDETLAKVPIDEGKVDAGIAVLSKLEADEPVLEFIGPKEIAFGRRR